MTPYCEAFAFSVIQISVGSTNITALDEDLYLAGLIALFSGDLSFHKGLILYIRLNIYSLSSVNYSSLMICMAKQRPDLAGLSVQSKQLAYK